MTNAGPDGALSPLEANFERATPLRLGQYWSALVALFELAVRQNCRARRLFILAGLFLLPAAIAVAARYASGTVSNKTVTTSELEFGLLYTLIPHALAPLAALLYASGMIQDEIEDQTLTYLLVRPLPKWTIYLAKFLATFLIAALLAGFFTLITCLAIHVGKLDFSLALVLERAGKTTAILVLALFTYCSVFGCLSLLVKRSLVTGVVYIIVFEGLLANIDFAVRRLTVMHYFRVLTERWLDVKPSDWSLNLSEAPGSAQCVGTLLAAGLAFLVLGALTFSTREFRVKTPEGS